MKLLVPAVLALVFCTLPSPVRADAISSVDLFAGADGGTSAVSTTGNLLSGSSATGALGSGYTGTVTAGPAYSTARVTVNDTATPGEVVFTSDGLASVAPTFSITKTFAGETFAPDTTYVFTLSTAMGDLTLLSAVTVDIAAGGNEIANSGTGTGLPGGSPVDVLAALNDSEGGTTTFTFTTASDVDAIDAMTFTLSGNGLLDASSHTATFTGATVAVETPEPATYLYLGAAVALAYGLRRRPALAKAAARL